MEKKQVLNSANSNSNEEKKMKKAIVKAATTEATEQVAEDKKQKNLKAAEERKAIRAQKVAENKQKKEEARKARIRSFKLGSTHLPEADLKQKQDGMFGILKDIQAKNISPDKLTVQQTAAVAFACLLEKGNMIDWKQFIDLYNENKMNDMRLASRYSDPHYGVTKGNEKVEENRFNLRQQIHFAQGGRRGEKFEKYPMRLATASTLSNTAVHAQDRANGNEDPRQRLQSFTLPPQTFNMLEKESAMVAELRGRYFKK